ncbi:MAG: acetyltransferase [Flavobacterium sp.]
MEDLLIIGTGDYATVASYYLKEKFNIIGYAEEKSFRVLNDLMGMPIYDFENIKDIFNPSKIKILVAIGPNFSNTIRERLYKEVKKLNFKCITFIHSDAKVYDINAIGENSFIFPNVVVEPYATVGNNCVLWSGAILAHHSKLLDNCFMAPGALISGRTIVNNNCFFGINSTVRDNLVIEKNCIIGAGAIIKKSTVENGVYSSNGTLLLNNSSFNTKV